MLLGLERNLLRELIEQCRFTDRINLNYDNRAQFINKLIVLLYTVQDQTALTIVLDILKCKYTYLDADHMLYEHVSSNWKKSKSKYTYQYKNADVIKSSITKKSYTQYETLLSNMNKLLQEQDELIKKLYSHFNFDFEQQDKK